MADISLSSPPTSPPPAAQRRRSLTPSDVYDAVTRSGSFSSNLAEEPGQNVQGTAPAAPAVVCCCSRGQKRTFEEMNQFVEAAARQLKLKAVTKKQLVSFARVKRFADFCYVV